MQNFTFQNSVKVVFGKGTIPKLPECLDHSHKVMIVYGGGSIKQNGVYKQVTEALHTAGIVYEEFGGIEANPDFSTCLKCVDKIRATNCTFVLAVGGGSVADAAKFICAAHNYDGTDPWHIIETHGYGTVKSHLPLGVVLTLPATGSEMNWGSVISRRATMEKSFFNGVFPSFSILDPETTYTLPEHQTTNGIADAFCHVLEQYVTHDKDVPVQDHMCEAVLKSLIEEAPRVLAEPHNYDARANIMWACTVALNTWIQVGVAQDWATHMIGHELTADYGLDHGKTLSIVGPALYRQQFKNKKISLARLGRNVFNITDADDEVVARKAIDAVEHFYRDVLHIKTKLSEYSEIKDPSATPKQIAKKFADRDPKTKLGETGAIGIKDIEDILVLAH